MIRDYIIYPKVYIDLYRLLKHALGPAGSISPMLFDEKSRSYLLAMEKAKILKFVGKNIAVRKELPQDFIDQLQWMEGK